MRSKVHITGPATAEELAGVDEWLARDIKLEPPADLVMDTNVLLAIASLHDVLEEVEKSSAASWEAAALESDDIRYLLQRAQDAILLAWTLHERKLRPFLLAYEAKELLPRRVPEGLTEKNMYTTIVVNFVFEHVLSDMELATDEEGLDKDIVGDARDDLAVAVAVVNNIPLITFEGNSKTGSFDRKRDGELKIRGKAKSRGAQVFTPGEYLDHLGIDRAAARDAFVRRFNELAPGWLAQFGGHAKTNMKEIGLYIYLVLKRQWWP